MREIGKVTAILNRQHLLVEVTEELVPDSTVTVCGRAKLGEDESVGLEFVRYPKGKLIVLAKQENGIYLVSTAKFKYEEKTVYRNPFSPAAMVLSDYFGEKERVFERVPEDSPAVVDEKQSIGISMPMKIRIGDDVCVEE